MESSKVDRSIKIAIGVLFVALAWVIVSTMRERIVDVGDTAPSFTVTTQNGTRISLDQFGGKVLLLNFWATWCAPCVQEVPSLNQLQKQLGNSGLVVLGVSVDRSESAYATFLKRFNIVFPTSRDPQEDISASYGTYRFPESYLIDKNGKVLQKYIGPPEKGWTDPEIVNSLKAYL
jgi:cytochrome c biogenesis protein CcmG/thiol:disulfide interchange protein DsbE